MRLIDADNVIFEFNRMLDNVDERNAKPDQKEEFTIIRTYIEWARYVVECVPTVDAVSREKYEASVEARKILAKYADDLLAELKERVEVVRCKDCKRWTITSDGFGECEIMEKQFLGKEYCSFGEKKNDD